MRKAITMLVLLGVFASASAAVINPTQLPGDSPMVHWGQGGYGNHGEI